MIYPWGVITDTTPTIRRGSKGDREMPHDEKDAARFNRGGHMPLVHEPPTPRGPWRGPLVILTVLALGALFCLAVKYL